MFMFGGHKTESSPRPTMPKMNDLVAEWEVELSDKKHLIQFEHGTLTGKRVIWVDGNIIFRKDYVFDLVGCETFSMLGNKFVIAIRASALDYLYSLSVNGVDVERFAKQQLKALKTWVFQSNYKNFRVALEKDSLDIWVNGEKIETRGEFVEGGTETHFFLEPGLRAHIKATHSGRKSTGIIHTLFVNGLDVVADS